MNLKSSDETSHEKIFPTPEESSSSSPEYSGTNRNNYKHMNNRHAVLENSLKSLALENNLSMKNKK